MTKDTAIGPISIVSYGAWAPVGQLSGEASYIQQVLPWNTSVPVEPNLNVLKEGTKHDSGKVGVHLLPPDPLIEIAKVLDFGAKKYDPYNWSKGIKYSRLYGALLRHMWAWWKGESSDSETGLSHLAHAGCCLLFLLQYETTRKEFDDRPVKEYTISAGPNKHEVSS